MIAPERRLMLWPVSSAQLEIIVLGDPFDLAGFVAELLSALGSHAGFDSVTPIAMGAQLLGFRVHRGPLATYDDPATEAMHVLQRFKRLSWHEDHGARGGIVATW